MVFADLIDEAEELARCRRRRARPRGSRSARPRPGTRRRARSRRRRPGHSAGVGDGRRRRARRRRCSAARRESERSQERERDAPARIYSDRRIADTAPITASDDAKPACTVVPSASSTSPGAEPRDTHCAEGLAELLRVLRRVPDRAHDHRHVVAVAPGAVDARRPSRRRPPPPRRRRAGGAAAPSATARPRPSRRGHATRDRTSARSPPRPPAPPPRPGTSTGAGPARSWSGTSRSAPSIAAGPPASASASTNRCPAVYGIRLDLGDERRHLAGRPAAGDRARRPPPGTGSAPASRSGWRSPPRCRAPPGRARPRTGRPCRPDGRGRSAGRRSRA